MGGGGFDCLDLLGYKFNLYEVFEAFTAVHLKIFSSTDYGIKVMALCNQDLYANELDGNCNFIIA